MWISWCKNLKVNPRGRSWVLFTSSTFWVLRHSLHRVRRHRVDLAEVLSTCTFQIALEHIDTNSRGPTNTACWTECMKNVILELQGRCSTPENAITWDYVKGAHIFNTIPSIQRLMVLSSNSMLHLQWNKLEVYLCNQTVVRLDLFW